MLTLHSNCIICAAVDVDMLVATSLLIVEVDSIVVSYHELLDATSQVQIPEKGLFEAVEVFSFVKSVIQCFCPKFRVQRLEVIDTKLIFFYLCLLICILKWPPRNITSGHFHNHGHLKYSDN